VVTVQYTYVIVLSATGNYYLLAKRPQFMLSPNSQINTVTIRPPSVGKDHLENDFKSKSKSEQM